MAYVEEHVVDHDRRRPLRRNPGRLVVPLVGPTVGILSPHFRRTAFATCWYDPEVFDWAARDSALRARAFVSIGYFRWLGYANAESGSRFRLAALSVRRATMSPSECRGELGGLSALVAMGMFGAEIVINIPGGVWVILGMA